MIQSQKGAEHRSNRDGKGSRAMIFLDNLRITLAVTTACVVGGRTRQPGGAPLT